ncbi:MAG: CDP-2,3-bis-(O-geranylgeranyl)-sn-glycerol synthase [archaeon]|nr:CDP-2,3-bis-(O-geranylgeranyl)-sn-glycerol synthase [archaeon]
MFEFADILTYIAVGIWLWLPAMIPNVSAVIIGRKFGRTKMDFGRTWRGKRILGDGKSWAGFFGGAFTGVFVGIVQICVAAKFGSDDYWRFGPFWGNIGILFCLSFGALVGDACGAFIKRRLGMEKGAKALILDQYDFFVGAIIITAMCFPEFVKSNYIEGMHIAALIFVVILTYVMHRTVNIIGYRIGVKDVPW